MKLACRKCGALVMFRYLRPSSFGLICERCVDKIMDREILQRDGLRQCDYCEGVTPKTNTEELKDGTIVCLRCSGGPAWGVKPIEPMSEQKIKQENEQNGEQVETRWLTLDDAQTEILRELLTRVARGANALEVIANRFTEMSKPISATTDSGAIFHFAQKLEPDEIEKFTVKETWFLSEGGVIHHRAYRDEDAALEIRSVVSFYGEKCQVANIAYSGFGEQPRTMYVHTVPVKVHAGI